MSAPRQLSLHSIIRRRSGLLTQDVDDCSVVDDGTNTCFGLEIVARRIWHLIEDPRTVNDVCDELVEAYDVDRGSCQCEVLEFLEDLKGEGLIEVLE